MSDKKENQEYLTPLLEIRAYGRTNKVFMLGRDISLIGRDMTLYLDSKGADELNITLDLQALGDEIYKDKANSGLKIK